MATLNRSTSLGVLYLCLAGVLAAHDLQNKCRRKCDTSGDILDCQLTSEGQCILRNIVSCRKKGDRGCDWLSWKVLCEEDIPSKSNVCDEAKTWRHGGFAVNTKSQTRRDLGNIPDSSHPLSPRSAMVSTTGNGYAFVLDNDKLIESRFGAPQTLAHVDSNAFPTADNILAWPFTFLSAFAGKGSTPAEYFPSTTPVPPPVQPQEPVPYGGFRPKPYTGVGGYLPPPPPAYAPSYRPPYGGFGFAPERPPFFAGGVYADWDAGSGFRLNRNTSPFQNFFAGVGLQDPMSMLKYLG